MKPDDDPNSQCAAGPAGLLQLLHLADSALPIGATAHSFGMETLIAEAGLEVQDLPLFFEDWLRGQGHAEAVFCHRAYMIQNEVDWLGLNAQISSFRPARESREASLRLGKRLLALVEGLITDSILDQQPRTDAHLCAAFGRVGRALEIDTTLVAAAYLHQTVFGAISVCQRLLPFGQTAAMKLLWRLKPGIQQAAENAKYSGFQEIWSLQPMLEIASMRHPQLTTRLFIS